MYSTELEANSPSVDLSKTRQPWVDRAELLIWVSYISGEAGPYAPSLFAKTMANIYIHTGRLRTSTHSERLSASSYDVCHVYDPFRSAACFDYITLQRYITLSITNSKLKGYSTANDNKSKAALRQCASP